MSCPLLGIARLAHNAPILAHKRRVTYARLDTHALLNRCRSRRVPFGWTINPYRGCELGCRYCYARYTHEFMEFREVDDFETRIFAKRWDMASFRQQLRKAGKREVIGIGTATDPYQPAERRYGLTRAILEVLAGERGRRVVLTTKSDLVVRDLELLQRITAQSELNVNMTITTLDEELARKLEPRAARPGLRLEALRRLAAAGIECGVLCCPVMPGLNDGEGALWALGRAARRAGAKWLVANPLFLREPARELFFRFLAAEFPELLKRYEGLYRHGAYVGRDYREHLQERVKRIRARLGYPEAVERWREAPVAEEQLRLEFI